MAAGIYKSDQGYWTRMLTAIGAGVLTAAGGLWIAGQLSAIDLPRNEQGEQPIEPVYLQGGAAAVVFLIGAVMIYWLVYVKPRTSEFLIATEGEMKKVNWSNRREIIGSTWVVVSVSVIIAAILFVVDIGFSRFFRMINVLEVG